MRDKMGTNNKLNTPYRTNAEYAKKKANESGKEASNLNDTTSRYEYEFGNESNISEKDSALARGANISDAFSYPLAGATETTLNTPDYSNYNEEYAKDNLANTELRNAREMKKRFQKNLRQNYNVEFSDDELIDEECNENCENCPRCR